MAPQKKDEMSAWDKVIDRVFLGGEVSEVQSRYEESEKKLAKLSEVNGSPIDAHLVELKKDIHRATN